MQHQVPPGGTGPDRLVRQSPSPGAKLARRAPVRVAIAWRLPPCR